VFGVPVSDRVLLLTNNICSTPPISVSCARAAPRWGDAFTVTACLSLKAYTLALPRWIRSSCSPTVNVDRLKRSQALRRASDGIAIPGAGGGRWAGWRALQWPSTGEVELLLNQRLVSSLRRHPPALPGSGGGGAAQGPGPH
jgi:hypothetical protein